MIGSGLSKRELSVTARGPTFPLEASSTIRLLLMGAGVALSACSLIKGTYRATKGAAEGTFWAAKGAYTLTAGTTKLVYKIGKFTFVVVRAPLEWPLMNDDIESIDDLPPKEAIRQGRVKNSPYTVKGKKYYPMTVEEAQDYQEEGIASWYGYETLRQEGGHMTANGEAFNPKGLTAAHKHLPLPTNVRVTNLENGRSIIVRVNDRGPFAGRRIIDLSQGAARRLGFYSQGTARVRVETIPVDGA